MADKPVKEVVAVDAALDALVSPTSSDVYEAVDPFSDQAVAAVAAKRALSPGGSVALDDLTDVNTAGGSTGDVLTQKLDGSFDLEAPGGGSQPGAVRRLTVDVAAADLAEGPVTLYTPIGGEVVGPVYLYGVVFCNSSTAITIGRDEQVASDSNFPALAGWDSDLSRDSAGVMSSAPVDLAQVPLTTSPVTAGFTTDGTIDTLQAGAWETGHVYAGLDTIAAAGHTWYAFPGGTSGGSKPDFAANFGGTVTDNDITWNDNGDATAGSATVSFEVCTPAAP